MRIDTESLNQHYAEYYGGASDWRELGGRDKARSIASLVGDEAISSVIDVGCGEGSVIFWLQKYLTETSFLGIEVSPSAIAAARERSFVGEVEFALFDGLTIDASESRYDLGILSHVVEHVADPRTLIRETARVARQIVVEVPLELHLRTPNYEWDDVGHINVYNRRSIRHLIETCGLRVLRERIYCPSLQAHTFNRRVGSTLKWTIKAAALRAGGQGLFTYHYTALAESAR